MPPRPPGYALLRLLVAGICNTDLELQRGYYGFSGTPGHEFVAKWSKRIDRALSRQARGGRNQSGLRRIASGAARAWAGTAPTAPCWASSSIPAHSRNTSRCPNATCTRCPGRAYPPSAPCSPNRWPRPARFSTRSRSRAASRSRCWATANWGCWSRWCSMPTAIRVRQFGRHAREARHRRARAELHRRWLRGELPAAAVRLGGGGYRHRPRACAQAVRHDAPARHRDSEIHRARPVGVDHARPSSSTRSPWWARAAGGSRRRCRCSRTS